MSMIYTKCIVVWIFFCYFISQYTIIYYFSKVTTSDFSIILYICVSIPSFFHYFQKLKNQRYPYIVGEPQTTPPIAYGLGCNVTVSAELCIYISPTANFEVNSQVMSQICQPFVCSMSPVTSSMEASPPILSQN